MYLAKKSAANAGSPDTSARRSCASCNVYGFATSPGCGPLGWPWTAHIARM